RQAPPADVVSQRQTIGGGARAAPFVFGLSLSLFGGRWATLSDRSFRSSYGAFRSFSRPPFLAPAGRTHEASVRSVAAGEALTRPGFIPRRRSRRWLLPCRKRAVEGERRFALGRRAHPRHSRARSVGGRACDRRRLIAVGVGVGDPRIRTRLHQ